MCVLNFMSYKIKNSCEKYYNIISLKLSYWIYWPVMYHVPKNLTHLLLPLNLTANSKLKRIEQGASAEYISKNGWQKSLNTWKPVLRILHAWCTDNISKHQKGNTIKLNKVGRLLVLNYQRSSKVIKEAQNGRQWFSEPF